MKHTINKIDLWPQILLLIAIVIVVIVLFAGRFVFQKLPQYWAQPDKVEQPVTKEVLFKMVSNGELNRFDNAD